ncbi:hypothetical protein [Methylobacterium sp.]|uniref:hypothetical protein n=1 Tax=Methylobacterium sp. TaxID=409 RepID=UPI000FBF5F2C|nr:hypothetical protein [Methylobacterium sp.]RUP17456.1 MAG: hypothetical protein EKK44_29015 [Methylobacterium sp.]
MADRPILFSAPMVQALLREARQPGTGKTQTRRILTRLSKVGAVIEFGPSDTTSYDWHFRDKGMRWHDLRDAELKARSPWRVSDRLWVKEKWQIGSGFDGPQIAFRATGDCHDIEAWDGEDECAGPSFNYARCPGANWHTWLPDLLSGAEGIWRPSLFMPRWASRLTLLVTDVQVERLHDISEADVIAEGLKPETCAGQRMWDPGPPHGHFAHPQVAYRMIWEEIHGPGSWDANPWIVAVTFSVHTRNIDQLAPAEALDIAGPA